MLRVVGCILDMHDLRLVFLAAVICIFSCYTAINLKHRAWACLGTARNAWLMGAAFVIGSGVWATHFVAELAFRPGLPIAYDISETILSVVVAIAVTGLGLFITHQSKTGGLAALGGAVVGLGVAAMHYIGMMALRLPATAIWDSNYIIASVIISVSVGSLAMIVAQRRKDLRGRLLATGLLVLAIVGLHFTGMSAVTFIPDPTVTIPDQAIAPEWLAIAIAAVTLLIVGLGLAGAVFDQHLAERSTQEAVRLRAYISALEATKNDLSEALLAKSQFLAAMSHELRTPLNAVIGFSDIMQKEMFGPIENKQYKEYIPLINKSGTHLLSLINDILDLNRLDTKSLEIEETPIDLNETVADCVQMVAPQAKNNQLTLTTNFDPEVRSVQADPKRLRQILLSILSNAVKFTPEGGSVTARTSAREDGVEIEISDTGIGIASQDIARALEPFGQIDSRLSRKYEGAGLGLSLAKQLIELHGGSLVLESEVNAGTTVRLYLPVAKIRAAA